MVSWSLVKVWNSLYQILFDLFAVDIHYHNTCYLIYSNNLSGKSVKTYSDQEIKNKYLIIKARRKFNQKLSMRTIRLSEAITKWIEAILAYANSLERELLKNLKINLIFSFCKTFYFVQVSQESMSV